MAISAEILQIEEEERGLELNAFTHDDAWWLGTFLRVRAVEKALPVTIEIRRGNTTLFLVSMEGATADNGDWTRRKLNAATRFERSSLAMAMMLRELGRKLPEAYGLDAADYAAAGGAVPIRVKDCGVVGAVAVSGLTSEEDHHLVVTGLRALKERAKVRAGGGPGM